jgi:hypothetical protein
LSSITHTAGRVPEMGGPSSAAAGREGRRGAAVGEDANKGGERAHGRAKEKEVSCEV